MCRNDRGGPTFEHDGRGRYAAARVEKGRVTASARGLSDLEGEADIDSILLVRSKKLKARSMRDAGDAQ